MTFLFTDAEGSTRLWEDQPDEMNVALARHDEILRSAIAQRGGYVFSTGGDGFAAAFSRAVDAVDAARDAQAEIARLDLISVRMGLNTGEAHERDGDYFGPAVNRTARLMSAGHGGQVLLAAVTAELVPGLVLQNLGEHRLRDLGTPMFVWQLGTGNFPPLRTLDKLPGNLPVQRTSFVGRTAEVKELAALVGRKRLVTLTGPGGVGKSRLALQVAAELAPTFADGVWFASLAALDEGALTAATIIEAMKVPERRGEAAIETLCAWARTRGALVVIDNCEHLLAETAEVIDHIMEASESVTILATSQSPLGLRGEHVWTVSPLSGARGSSRDSVELFVDRARMARADFALTPDSETAVIEICDRLDHIPLAIELAAARARGMAPGDIARRLDQRLRLLASNDRLAPGRHQTLDAAVRWSYELLDETQQMVFDRLSVFAGPFTVEAAEAVVAGDGVDEWAVLDGILALVDKSLVEADETGSGGGTRYRLLETMRQFGQADIADAGVLELYRSRHAAFYAEYVLSRRAQLLGSGDTAALDAVESELENIRVALRQAADDRLSPRFEGLFTALYPLWMGRARTSEGASWALALRCRPDLDPAARIVALGFAANVLMSSSLDDSLEMAEASDRLWFSSGAASPLIAVAVMSVVAAMRGEPATALELCDRLLELPLQESEPFEIGMALSTCYAVHGLCGALEALDQLERDVNAVVERLGNRWLRVATANSLATVIQLTDPDRAGDRLRSVHELNREVDNHGGSISSAMFLALHELRSGDDLTAARWAAESLGLAIEHGPSYVAQVVDAIVAIIRRRAPADAATLLGALRAHRARTRADGTRIEIDAEARYESSLRRDLGDGFDARYGQGLSLDDTGMIELAFSQLDEVTGT